MAKYIVTFSGSIEVEDASSEESAISYVQNYTCFVSELEFEAEEVEEAEDDANLYREHKGYKVAEDGTLKENKKYEVYANIQIASPNRPYNKKELDLINSTLNEWFIKWTDGEVTLSKFNYPEPKDWYPADVLEDGYEIWVGLTFVVRKKYPFESNFNVFNWKEHVFELNFFPNEQTIFDFCEGEYKGKEVREIENGEDYK